MRVIVTGASGFIGKHVLPFLIERGWEVFAVVRRLPEHQAAGVHWIAGDILKINSDQILWEKIKRIQATHLLHLAWYTKHRKFWHAEVNFCWVEASLGLLRSFYQGGGTKAVIAGTCAEYDWSYGYFKEEITPCHPSSVYGICKYSLYLMAKAWCESVGMRLCWGRVFFPYGPGESKSRLIPYMVQSFMNGTSPVCRSPGAYRDLLHVEDVARAFCVLMEQGNGVFNISSGKPVRIQDVADKVASLVGVNTRTHNSDVAPDDPALLVGANERISMLGWRQMINLREGLESYINYLKESEST